MVSADAGRQTQPAKKLKKATLATVLRVFIYDLENYVEEGARK
jgi:hypothetical protein